MANNPSSKTPVDCLPSPGNVTVVYQEEQETRLLVSRFAATGTRHTQTSPRCSKTSSRVACRKTPSPPNSTSKVTPHGAASRGAKSKLAECSNGSRFRESISNASSLYALK